MSKDPTIMGPGATYRDRPDPPARPTKLFETIAVRAPGGGRMVIRKSDYDPATHTLWDEVSEDDSGTTVSTKTETPAHKPSAKRRKRRPAVQE